MSYVLLVETNIVHIRDTNLLISAGYSTYAGAIEIFDISKRKPKRIFSFCDTFRHITTKDIAYCHKRNLFAVFPTKDSLSYHLFEIQYRVDGIICSLIKKAKQRIDSRKYYLLLKIIQGFINTCEQKFKALIYIKRGNI